MNAYGMILKKIEANDYTNKMNYPEGSYKDIVVREKRRLYTEESWRLNNLFKVDLEKIYGFTNHPKKDTLWRLSWENGHSNGIYEVLNYYDEYSELLKE